MPRIGVSITKTTPFRNFAQEFSNVYYYESLTMPTVAQADDLIDRLTTLEKTFHGNTVTFVRGRCWSQIGGPSENEMISQKNLSGIGSMTINANMDKERAFLFRLRAGVDGRGTPVYLRKWYHACGEFVAGQAASTGVLANTTSWTAGERAAQVAKMNAIGDGNGMPALTLKLCAKSGRLPGAGNTWEAHAYLEHHQLGDQWRAQ